MREYVARPRGDWSGIAYEGPAPFTVIEPEPLHRDTGLVDRHGRRLYAVDRIGPIGFTRITTGD